MAQPKPQHPDTSSREEYYESARGLQNLASWYNVDKEKSFIDFIFNRLQIPHDGLVVEIGGGAAVHGRLLATRFGTRYLFTDLSQNFVAFARELGLAAEQMDGLSMPLADGSAACTVLVATSTLVHDRTTRERQFRECARVLRSDGVSVFVTARRDRRYHCWDDDDLEFLRQLGLSLIWLRGWGIVPGRLWTAKNRQLLDAIETIAAKTSLPARYILCARRLPDQSAAVSTLS